MVIATEGSRRNTPTQKKMYKNLSKKKSREMGVLNLAISRIRLFQGAMEANFSPDD